MLLECVSSISSIVQDLCFSSLLKLISLTCWIHGMHKLLPVEWILFSESHCRLPVGKKGAFFICEYLALRKNSPRIGRILPSHVIRLFQHTRTLSRLVKYCAQLLQLPNELFHTQKNSATDETIFQKTWTSESLWIQWSSGKHFYSMPWTQKGCQGCHTLSVVWP